MFYKFAFSFNPYKMNKHANHLTKKCHVIYTH